MSLHHQRITIEVSSKYTITEKTADPLGIIKNHGAWEIVQIEDFEIPWDPTTRPLMLTTWPLSCPDCGEPWKVKSRTMGRAHGQPHKGSCVNGHIWNEP